MEYAFERLLVWQKSREFVLEIYRITGGFPPSEKFGLVTQLRRAAISISSNIAEGSTRNNAKDKARFYEIAYGSLIETLNQIILAHDLEYVPTNERNNLRLYINEIAKMLSALRKVTLKKLNQAH